MIRALLVEYTILDITLVIIYVYLIVYLSQKIKKKCRKFSYLFLSVGFLHLAMTFVYYFYSLSNVADAIGFFRRTVFLYDNWFDTFGQGSRFIFFTLYPLVKFLGLTYFGSYFVYSFIGLCGFYLLLNIGMNVTQNKFNKYFYLFLLPNSHFWTVAIGKDSLVFYALAHILYNLYFKKNIQYYIIPFIIVGYIRIHILAFILISYAITQLLFNKNIKYKTRIFVVSIVSVSVLLLFPIVMDYVGARDGQTVVERFEELEGNLMQGGSSLDMRDQNIVVKTASFLFRPAIYEVRNLVTLMAALENIVWLFVFYSLVRFGTKYIYNERLKYIYWLCIISALSIIIPSSMILVNLGIAMRQKYMAFPFILIAVIIATKNKKTSKKIYA